MEKILTNEQKAKGLAKDYAPTIENLDAKIVLYEAMMQMAEWMKSYMIEKSRLWLEERASSYMSIYWEQGGYATPEFDTEKLIEDFRKAMEQ